MMYSKEYSVGQNSQKDKSKKDYYKWAVWIDANESDLSDIDHVEYLLHPTFPNRLRQSDDPSSNFKIESKGWGEFRIDISITKISGEVIKLGHWLSLSDDNTQVVRRGGPEEEETEPKKVYISYSKIDTGTAQLVESMLTDLGMKEASGSDIQPGVPISEYIEKSIDNADAIITINPGMENDWQKLEIKIAEDFSKTIIPLDVSGDSEESKSLFSSRMYSDEEYGENLKALGDKIKNIKS